MRTLDELTTEICTLAGHLNAANHRLLVLIAEFDRSHAKRRTFQPECRDTRVRYGSGRQAPPGYRRTVS
jgi:hypothetical protein